MILADSRVDGSADHDHVQLGRLLRRSRLHVHAQIAIGQVKRHGRVDLLGLRVERAAVPLPSGPTCRIRGSAANAAIIAFAYFALRSTDGAGVGVGCAVAGAGVSGAALEQARTANAHERRARRERERSSETSERACSDPFATVKGTFGSVRSPSTEQQSHRHDGPDRDDRRARRASDKPGRRPRRSRPPTIEPMASRIAGPACDRSEKDSTGSLRRN